MKVHSPPKGPRLLASMPDRVETGALQFGDDWPGLFIRGDSAAHYALNLQQLLTDIGQGTAVDPVTLVVCGNLSRLLANPIQGPARSMLEASQPPPCASAQVVGAGESRS